jgi:hypothetical protein
MARGGKKCSPKDPAPGSLEEEKTISDGETGEKTPGFVPFSHSPIGSSLELVALIKALLIFTQVLTPKCEDSRILRSNL